MTPALLASRTEKDSRIEWSRDGGSRVRGSEVVVELARGLLDGLDVLKKSIVAVVGGGLLRRAMGGEDGALMVLPPSVVVV